MKKIIGISLLMMLMMVSFSGCSLHFPDGFDWDSPVYRVILKVNPDDSEVLLNGKVIGFAYEFSTSDSALRLASRTNELVIKREGYVEEEINLYDYSSHRIVIRLELQEDRDYSAPPPVKARPPKPLKPSQGKTVPKVVVPEEEETDPAKKPVDVTLEVTPEESAIYLDGRFWGLAPKSGVIGNLRLKPGKYELAVVKPGYGTYKKTLFIADQPVKLTVKLEKQ
ncbi:MAG: PEGA domain-containing protein [bacterium]|nr:PEGA domain-containing protein [bacterium]